MIILCSINYIECSFYGFVYFTDKIIFNFQINLFLEIHESRVSSQLQELFLRNNFQARK